MSEIITTSGKKAVINMASFRSAMALKNAVVRELSRAGVSFGEEIDGGLIARIVMLVDGSDDVFDALLGCLSRCTYDKEKITEATFEHEEARQDYYDIVIECLKVNITPFLSGLLSKLNTVEDAAKEKGLM